MLRLDIGSRRCADELVQGRALETSDFSAEALDQLDALDAAASECQERAARWASFNSGSFELANLRRMADELVPAFSGLPGPVETLALPPFARPGIDGAFVETALGQCLRIRVRPEAETQVLLTGHYDTVFAAHHPFQQVEDLGDRLHGPGVADMKGGLSIMLQALLALERIPEGERLGYTVLLSPDEEIGSPGSAMFLREAASRAQFGLTYEPATPDGYMVDARKGSGNFAIVVKGKAAHVGRAFADGRNAVVAAARISVELDQLNGVSDGVTVNVGAIEGGGPVNMVPAQALVRFNVRVYDHAQAEHVMAALRALIASADDGVTFELHGGFTRPPKPLNLAQQKAVALVQNAGRRVGLELGFRASGGVCEGNNLSAAGCPNIDTLGVVGGDLHSPQEWALKESFAERAKLSFSILQGIACGLYDVRKKQ